ncbi:MAG TPA: FtsW/RodA/SpoVE family cell cycle protein, partial [Candidatus Saccharimonadales bacterium]
MARTTRLTTDGYLRRHKADYSLLLITGLLLLLGTVMIYTISPALEQSSVLYRQLGHIGLAALAFLAAANLPLDIWRKLHLPMLTISLAVSALLLVPSLALEVNGATRWLDLGPFSFQPAEMLKFSLVIYLASWLAERKRSQRLNDFKETIVPLLFVTTGVGLLIAVLQKDLGTMIAIVGIVSSML